MQLSTRQQRLGTETAFETLAKAKKLEAQGKDIVHLEIGEPDFDSPDHVIEAAKKAVIPPTYVIIVKTSGANSNNGEKRITKNTPAVIMVAA